MIMEKPNKGKIILFSAIGGCSLLIIILVIYLFSSGKSNNSEDSKPPILSSKDNLTVKDMIDINGENKNEYGEKKDTIIDNTAKYNQQIEGIYGIGKAPEPQKTEPPRVAKSPTNSHDVYGNYDMWQSKEPSNSRIGYTNKSKNVESKSSSTPPKFDVVETPAYVTPTATPTPKVAEQVQSKQIALVEAKLLSTGFASNGRSLSFIILEPFTINNETVKKGQVITGYSTLKDNRLYVRFASVKLNGKTISLNGSVVGYDGEQGLPIASVDAYDDTNSNVKGEVMSQASRVPIVGGVVRSVSNITRKGGGSTANKIALTENLKCNISIYN